MSRIALVVCLASALFGCGASGGTDHRQAAFEWEIKGIAAQMPEDRSKPDYDLAISCYNEAIKLLPTYAHFYAMRAICLNFKGRQTEALADCAEALKFMPDGPPEIVDNIKWSVNFVRK